MKIAAIFVPDDLFKEVAKVAQENHYSRSEVFVIAVKEYPEKRRSNKLLAALNDAYSFVESPEEYKVRDKLKKRYSIAGHKARY